MSLPSSNTSLQMGNTSNHFVPDFMTFPKYHIEIIIYRSLVELGSFYFNDEI
jgi:hypothetical protein